MSYVFSNQKLFPVMLLGFIDPTDRYSYQGILTETGEVRKYESFEELLTHIDERRKAKGFKSIPNLDLVVQHYLYLVAEAHPSHFVRIDQTTADVPRTIKADAVAGAKIALEFSRNAFNGLFSAGPKGWVTSDIAEDRAKTCVNCVKNIDLEKSKFQRMNNKIGAVFTLNRNTTEDENLFDCGVCGCPNDQKVHYSDELVLKATPAKFKAKDFPEPFIGIKDRERHECWVRKILEDKEAEKI